MDSPQNNERELRAQIEVTQHILSKEYMIPVAVQNEVHQQSQQMIAGGELAI